MRAASCETFWQSAPMICMVKRFLPSGDIKGFTWSRLSLTGRYIYYPEQAYVMIIMRSLLLGAAFLWGRALSSTRPLSKIQSS